MIVRTPVSFIATAYPKAVEPFYTDVLGLSLREASPFALVFADGGHTLRVQIVPDHTPPAFTAYGWVVADIATEIKNLMTKGVTFLVFPHFEQDALGVWTTPDGAKIARIFEPRDL